MLKLKKELLRYGTFDQNAVIFSNIKNSVLGTFRSEVRI